MPRTCWLEHFGNTQLRNPYNNPAGSELWLAYGGDFTEPGDRGTITLSQKAAHDGWQGLAYQCEAGNPYLYFYPHNVATGVWSNLSDHGQGTYRANTFNRLSFWMYTPKGIWQHPHAAGFNLHIGDYQRSDKEKKAKEEPGMDAHYYRYAKIPDVPLWWRVECDWDHWHHQRGKQTQEWGIISHPFGARGGNALDCTTGFYIDFKGAVKDYTRLFSFDSFLLEKAPRHDNRAQVYTVMHGYDPIHQTMHVTWSHNRTEAKIKHRIRVFTASPHRVGWSQGQDVPDGLVTPQGDSAYNAMEWHGTVPDGATHLAIRPENAERFREITLVR